MFGVPTNAVSTLPTYRARDIVLIRVGAALSIYSLAPLLGPGKTYLFRISTLPPSLTFPQPLVPSPEDGSPKEQHGDGSFGRPQLPTASYKP